MCFAIVEKRSGRAVGWASYMRIEPAHRVIEVGNVMFSLALRRTAGATEAIYLMARNAFEALGYRRFEWKCNALNAASKEGRPAVRLHLRGDIPAAHDRQRSQQGHGVVLDDRR